MGDTKPTAAMTSTDDYLTAEQAAQKLDVSRRWLLQSLKHEIGYVKHGRKVWFDPKDLDVYLERKKVEAQRPK